jgi:dihydroorotate dehydrogenase
LVEFNLSCPNIPGRPPFYKDFDAVTSFLQRVCERKSALLNKNGHPGIYPKFGPMEQTPGEIELRRVIWQGTTRSYRDFGGVVTSNTQGNQHPKTNDGSDAIKVNGGKAGASGPAYREEGWRQLALWQGEANTQRLGNTGQLISVLGIDSGKEVNRRLRLGASACQLGSVLYWPQLVGRDSAGAVIETIKSEFADSY